MWDTCLCASKQWEIGERRCGMCASAGQPGKEGMWCMHICEHREARKRECSCVYACKATEEKEHRVCEYQSKEAGKKDLWGVCKCR